MIRRYTLDRTSFEQFLAAASLLQQFQRQLSRSGSDAQSLWMLVEAQRSIESGQMDLDIALQRIPQLAEQLIGGAGSGVWLFTDDDQFDWRSGAFAYSDNERLRLEVLNRLAASEDGLPRQPNRNWDAGYYPGCVKSLLVEPIRRGSRIAGALASFSTEFDAFTDRERAKLRLLAGLLSQAVDRASRMGLQQATALEQTAMRQLVSRLVPQIHAMTETQAARTEPEPPAKLPASDVNFELPVAEVPVEEQPLATLPFVSRADEVEEPLEPAGLPQPETSPVDEIYVPGLGVRSALYDDDPKEPSQFWAHLRSGVTHGVAATAGALHSMLRSIGHAGSRSAQAISAAGSATHARIQQAAQHRPKLPSLPSEKIREGLHHVGSNCRNAASRAGSRVRAAAHHVPKPVVSKQTIQHTVASAEAWTGKAIAKIERGLRAAPNVIPDVPTVPAEQIGRGLTRAASVISQAVITAGSRLGREFRNLSVPSVDLQNINPRALRRGVPALFVLAVMLAFVFSEMGWHKNVPTASASTRLAAPLAAAVVLPSPTVSAPTTSPDLSSAPTHRKVTDADIRSDLDNMTRYEIATARRAAQYGDDVSAFQLGMAYETGYDVPQNCAKAAEWVRRAAQAGYPAAEYNLGLRYRDGDGVAADPEQASAWLRKAADHKYGNAATVLAALSPSSR